MNGRSDRLVADGGAPRRVPSRRMPPPRRAGPVGKVLGMSMLVAILVGGMWLLARVWWPLPFAGGALLAAGILGGHRRAQRLAAARTGESICSFARSFARRSVDPWVIRATYEQLVAKCGFPVRADDQLENDLYIGDEDLDFLTLDILERAGRTLDRPEANPHFGKVVTVRDLVLFVEQQAR
jgi:hypothetical protein